MGKAVVLYFSLSFLSAILAFTLFDLKSNQVDYWVQRLEDGDAAGREEAALALGRLGPSAQDAVPALKKAKKQDGNEYVRKAAAESLHRVQASTPPPWPR